MATLFYSVLTSVLARSRHSVVCRTAAAAAVAANVAVVVVVAAAAAA